MNITVNYYSNTDIAEDVEAMISIYQNRNENYLNGGNLHIILEDGNLEDSSLNVCLTQALENKDYLGAEICTKLLQFDIDSRKIILN